MKTHIPSCPAILMPHLCPRTHAQGQSLCANRPPRRVWKPSKYLSVIDHIRTPWSVCATEYYKAENTHEICIHTATWVNLNHSVELQVDLYLYPYLYLYCMMLLRLISCVNLARPRYLDIWFNTILGDLGEVFSR